MPVITNAYRCDSCGWDYLPEEHSGVELDDQPEGWTCLNCGANRDHFQILVPPTNDVAEAAEDDAESAQMIDIRKQRVVYTKSTQPNVATLLDNYKDGTLDPQPDFQRYEVWTPQKKSRLIESILLDLPIPIIYLGQEQDETKIVIDGQQRLMAIFDFLDNKYSLKGLGPLKATLENLRFKEMPQTLQHRVRQFQLSTVEILKESDPLVKFDLFERLNMGATSLNDQELRNCIYRGRFNEFLKELAALPEFRRNFLKLDGPHKRMTDVELVLRFVAFWDQTYLKHLDKRTGEFLNRQMERGSYWSDNQYAKARKAFKKAVACTWTVFGDKGFKRFGAGADKEHPNGKWERTNNRALMDVQLYGFAQAKYTQGVITSRADTIRERAIELMLESEFSDLIRHTISEQARVERRFKLWLEMLDKVLKDTAQGPRLFNRQLKEEMYKRNKTCARCHQKIQDIDDAHLDHTIAYAKGGKTIPPNATLQHRICNLLKGAGA
ncbi:DUF262 domain-containing protein [Mycobacterium heckeshornense]|uniref:GmrSD restriction endonuclease domain-containing protein n=1 Tax=Mycobacterium heckeshornense TaxID=110505 RepID=UPI0013649C19|nr:DUF262 domain-containing protein [Mycobacterium heckeshornense]MCV7035684.1 DUF262 domain-containing protein [Mycobacterium heckeshornense]